MYKCMETSIIESIRSIRIDVQAPDVCHVACGLLEKWCFLMVDWARQSLYFKDIKVRETLMRTFLKIIGENIYFEGSSHRFVFNEFILILPLWLVYLK